LIIFLIFDESILEFDGGINIGTDNELAGRGLDVVSNEICKQIPGLPHTYAISCLLTRLQFILIMMFVDISVRSQYK
jgi:hypothetical protein